VEWIEFISLAAAVLALFAAGAVLFRVEGSAAGKLFAVGLLLFGGEAAINFVALHQTTPTAELDCSSFFSPPLSSSSR
jgi:hypothetical protein